MFDCHLLQAITLSPVLAIILPVSFSEAGNYSGEVLFMQFCFQRYSKKSI
jgi:hypothetical protein